jgi:N-acetylglutamate synthase-like GNAT family acetyltransferase
LQKAAPNSSGAIEGILPPPICTLKVSWFFAILIKIPVAATAGKERRMTDNEPPKTTGISDITGKTVKVRHATEADLFFIGQKMREHHFDTADLDYSEFVVATENSELIGFGRIRKTGAIYEVGCIIVVEEKKGKGIGKLILAHLLEFAPVRRVYAMTDWVEYFKGLGFSEMKLSK